MCHYCPLKTFLVICSFIHFRKVENGQETGVSLESTSVAQSSQHLFIQSKPDYQAVLCKQQPLLHTMSMIVCWIFFFFLNFKSSSLENLKAMWATHLWLTRVHVLAFGHLTSKLQTLTLIAAYILVWLFVIYPWHNFKSIYMNSQIGRGSNQI